MNTESLEHGYILVRQVPLTGRAYYFVAKFDGSFMSRTFSSKKNALKFFKGRDISEAKRLEGHDLAKKLQQRRMDCVEDRGI